MNGNFVADKEGLYVRHSIGDTVQSTVGMKNTHIVPMRHPNALESVVVHKTFLAKETLPAESFYIDGHAVAVFHRANLRSNFVHNAHHFMSYGDTLHRSRHAAMFDVKVACADAAHCDTHNGIFRRQQSGLLFLNQTKIAMGYK